MDNKAARPLLGGMILLTMIFVGGPAHGDDAVRCDGKLIDAGKSRIEVLKYCGDPQDKLSYLDERVTHTRLSTVQRGSTQFTRRTGYYVDSSRDFNTTATATTTSTTPSGQERKENAVSSSVTTLTQNHEHDENRLMQTTEDQTTNNYVTISTFWECKKSTMLVDEYVYNFGSGKFMTFVRFENGRVKDIKYGDYGFSR